MAEYIDLNNTEVLAEAGENAKLVVEEDGELKRIPASAVGQVKTVNGVEPDEAGNVVVSGLPEGVGGGMTLAYNGGFDKYMHHTIEGAYNRSEDDIWTLQELSNIAQSQMIAIGVVDEADGAICVMGIEYLEDAVFTAHPSYGYVTSIIGNRYYTAEYTGAPE